MRKLSLLLLVILIGIISSGLAQHDSWNHTTVNIKVKNKKKLKNVQLWSLDSIKVTYLRRGSIHDEYWDKIVYIERNDTLILRDSKGNFWYEYLNFEKIEKMENPTYPVHEFKLGHAIIGL